MTFQNSMLVTVNSIFLYATKKYVGQKSIGIKDLGHAILPLNLMDESVAILFPNSVSKLCKAALQWLIFRWSRFGSQKKPAYEQSIYILDRAEKWKPTFFTSVALQLPSAENTDTFVNSSQKEKACAFSPLVAYLLCSVALLISVSTPIQCPLAMA